MKITAKVHALLGLTITIETVEGPIVIHNIGGNGAGVSFRDGQGVDFGDLPDVLASKEIPSVVKDGVLSFEVKPTK